MAGHEPPRWPLSSRLQASAAARGAAGLAWLHGLEAQVAAVEARWEIVVDQPFAGGTEAFVASARDRSGADGVLKIALPGIDPDRNEIRILKAAAGRGFVRLLRSDEDANVMLLERLGPPIDALDMSEEEEVAAICAALGEAWRAPQPQGPPLDSGAVKARGFATQIGDDRRLAEGLCAGWALDLALAFTDRRASAFDPVAAVVCHGDAHQWNTLSDPATPGAFKLVDPDGAWAERAYDLAIYLREWGAPAPRGDRSAMARRRCALLAAAGAAPAQAIWEWGLIQIISNGLVLLKEGLPEIATAQLAMAEAWGPSAEG